MTVDAAAARGLVSRAHSYALDVIHSPRFLPVCFGVFLLLRLAVLLLPVVPTSDAGWYVDRGMELASGEGYHEGPWPTAYWPIGYPLFLAATFFLCGHDVISAQFVNLALSCGVFFLTYQLARRLFHDETAARLAVLLLTIYPNQIAYTGVLFSETLATFLLLLGFNIFMTKPTFGRTLASSLVLGFGALVKAQYLLSPGILLVVYGWGCWRTPHGMRRVASLALIFALGVTAVVLPVTIRNYVALHHFVLISTNGGRTFLSGNNPEARGDYTPDNSLIDGVRFSVEDQIAAEKRAYAIGIDWIRNNPGRFAILVPMKIWRLWAPDGEGEWWFQRGYAGYDDHIVAFRMARIFNQLYYTALLVGTAAAILLLFRRGYGLDRWVLIGPVLFAYLTLVAVVYSGQSRFHIPAMPFVVAYAGWWVSRLLDRGTACALGPEQERMV